MMQPVATALRFTKYEMELLSSSKSSCLQNLINAFRTWPILNKHLTSSNRTSLASVVSADANYFSENESIRHYSAFFWAVPLWSELFEQLLYFPEATIANSFVHIFRSRHKKVLVFKGSKKTVFLSFFAKGHCMLIFFLNAFAVKIQFVTTSTMFSVIVWCRWE